MSSLLTILVAVVNVPRKVGPRAWRRCFYAATLHGSVVGINEALSEAQRASYRRLAKRWGWGHAHLADSPNPIFWDRRIWRLKRSRVVRLHPAGKSALARQWPGYNAARYVTLVVLEHKTTGRRVTFLCTHLAAYGPKVPKAWRAWALARSWVVLAALTARSLAAGRPVVLMGDTNLRGRPRTGIPRFRWVAAQTIDKIGIALPRGVVLAEQSERSFTAPTDHQGGVHADLTLTFKE